jgi:hypothetical protein
VFVYLFIKKMLEQRDEEIHKLLSKVGGLEQENGVIRKKIGQLVAEKEASMSEVQQKLVTNYIFSFSFHSVAKYLTFFILDQSEVLLQVQEAEENVASHRQEITVLKEKLRTTEVIVFLFF